MFYQKDSSEISVVLYYFHGADSDSTLAYNNDWQDAFEGAPRLRVHSYNLAYRSSWYRSLARALFSDWIVFLHSTNSNVKGIPARLIRVLERRRGKVLIFIGNEYKAIPAKRQLTKDLRADYIVSQLPSDAAHWLYEGCPGRKLSVPHGLSPEYFSEPRSDHRRPIDLGFRGYLYPYYLGDDDRNRITQFFENFDRKGERVFDISIDGNARFGRGEWASFLKSCKLTISTEAGPTYLTRDDSIRNEVNDYTTRNPKATFEMVYDKFFKQPRSGTYSGKLLSSRHLEAIGTQTCQIMFEGRFNDILRPNEHYIPIKRDFSDVDEALEKGFDERFRNTLTANAFDYVRDHHTHQHRIDQLIEEAGG